MRTIYLCVPPALYRTQLEMEIELLVSRYLNCKVQNDHFHKGIGEEELFEHIYVCDGLVIKPLPDNQMSASMNHTLKVALACGKPIWIFKDSLIEAKKVRVE